MGIFKSEEVSRVRSLSQQKEYQCEPYITFRKMYLEEQLSIGVIAEKMGCSISKVQKYLKREGIAVEVIAVDQEQARIVERTPG